MSGAVLVLAFAPVNLWPLSFVAFILLFFSLNGVSSWKARFLKGFIFGLVFFLGTVYWVIHSMYFYGGVPFYLGALVTLLLAAVLALYPAAFAVLGWLPVCKNKWVRLVFVAALWVAIEYLRSILFTGFPWVLLGYSLASFAPLTQTAEIFGVWGVSFFIMFINAALFNAVDSFFAKKDRREAVLPLAAAVIVFVVFLVYGVFRMQAVDKEVLSWKEYKASLSQGNVEQSVKWEASEVLTTIEKYRALTKEAKNSGADIAVWPESAMTFYIDEAGKLTPLVTGAAKENNIYIVTGAPRREFNVFKKEEKFFNSAFMIDPSGNITGRYDKVHLVPFGEYVPLKNILFFIKKMTAGVGDFSAGEGYPTLKFDGARIGTLICYEAVFPEISAAFTRHGANVLVNLTNDGWFGNTSAPYQHLDMTRFRAIENRVYLLRSANTGISAVIDPAGRIVGRTELFKETNLTLPFRVRPEGRTFFSRFGMLFPFTTIIISVILIILGRRKNAVNT
ncbi:MAG: apolipoprotein N-acyltransferase [Deltaproteobacteria bacterium]|nr:apolipoprotein N-acyltransferase [Deltaproteobacteria bacterium]